MIWVTRLNGTEVVLNADLIEAIESTPDTVVTLVDGKKYVVSESAEELVARVRTFRASILHIVEGATHGSPESGAVVSLFPGGEDADVSPAEDER